MATVDILVQGKAKDAGAGRFLARLGKSADKLAESLDKLVLRDKPMSRFFDRQTKQAERLATALERAAKATGKLGAAERKLSGGTATKRRPRGAAAGGAASPPPSDPDDGEAKARARAGSDREARARRRARELDAEESVTRRARKRGEDRARKELEAEAAAKLGGGGGGGGRGRGDEEGSARRRRRRGGRLMDFAGDAASAAAEWRAFGSTMQEGLGASIDAARSYETAIADVTTVTELIPEEQIIAITTAATKEFGGKPVAQAQALYEVVSAGATDAATATEQLTQANILAIGGQAEVEDAVLALSKGVSNFKAQGATATEVADGLYVAVQKGQTDVTGMARALPRVAQAASSVGLSLDETNAALALLSLKSPTAEEGATNLKAALSNLQKPTKMARLEAARLGIDFSVAGLKAMGAAMAQQKYAEKLGVSVDALTEQQKAEAESVVGKQDAFGAFLMKIRASKKFNDNTLAKLFDSSDARAAVGALIDDMGGYQDSLDAMKHKEGAAAKAYGKMADTTAQKSARMEAEFELLKIEAGQALIPTLLDLGKELMPIIRDVTRWIKENPELASTIGKVAIAVVVLSTVGTALVSGFSLVSSTLAMGSSAAGLFGVGAAKAGKGLATMASSAGGANIGLGALVVTSYAFGAAIGSWLDKDGDVSDFFADALAKATGLNDELERAEELTPKTIRHEGLSEKQVLLGQRERLQQAVDLAREGTKGTATPLDFITELSGTQDIKDAEYRRAMADLSRFDAQHAKDLGISDASSWADSGDIAQNLAGMVRAVEGVADALASRREPGWMGPSAEAGLG